MSKKLLTLDQMRFLADKLGYGIVSAGLIRYEHKAPEYAIAEDGSLVDSSDIVMSVKFGFKEGFWYIRNMEDYQRGVRTLQLSYVGLLSPGRSYALCEYYKVIVFPKEFIHACEKYFGKAPFYVKDKQVSTIYVKQNGTIKPAKPYIKQSGQIKAL